MARTSATETPSDTTSEPAVDPDAAADTRRRRPPPNRWRYRLSRLPSRAVLIIAFVLAIAAAGVAILPFNTTTDTGTELQCGPPLYEVLVPADPAFDVPEDAGCLAPAQRRLVLAAFMVGLAFVAAAIVHIGRRYDNRYHWGPWLAGPDKRRRRRRRPRPTPPSGIDVVSLERREGSSSGDRERAGTSG